MIINEFKAAEWKCKYQFDFICAFAQLCMVSDLLVQQAWKWPGNPDCVLYALPSLEILMWTFFWSVTAKYLESFAISNASLYICLVYSERTKQFSPLWSIVTWPVLQKNLNGLTQKYSMMYLKFHLRPCGTHWWI